MQSVIHKLIPNKKDGTITVFYTPLIAIKVIPHKSGLPMLNRKKVTYTKLFIEAMKQIAKKIDGMPDNMQLAMTIFTQLQVVDSDLSKHIPDELNRATDKPLRDYILSNKEEQLNFDTQLVKTEVITFDMTSISECGTICHFKKMFF